MSGQRGFTLLETMVAVAILAVALTAVGGGLSMVVRSTALASGYERARTVAENELALFLTESPQRPSTESGASDGVSWQLRAESDEDVDGLLHVRVEATFYAAGGNRTFVLETRQSRRELPESTTSKASS